VSGPAVPLRLVEFGDPGYEEARRASVWNMRKPDRFPAAIAAVRDADEVVAAVKLARERGMRVTVRSGGHGWSAPHLRDGALLIDMSEMTGVEIDAVGETAWVQPGVKGEQLLRELREHDLFFTTGHCNDVGLGGFTLGGGFGWMSREHGMACTSVLAVDVVTADGELVRADPTQNVDLYWAARGAGHGFFGVVTRFHFRLYPRRAVTMLSADLYPRELLDDLLRWFDAIKLTIPRTLELRMMIARNLPGIDGVGIRVAGSVFTDTVDEAKAILAVLDQSPVLDRAVSSLRNAEADVLDLVMMSDEACQPGKRMAADNMWTGAAIDDLLPGARRLADTLPFESFVMWHVWGAVPTVADDMFYSLEDHFNVAVYAVWEHEADDDAAGAWPALRLREMEHLATGIQLNDENLYRRPGPVASAEALRRFEEIRQARDPARLFYSWMAPDLDA
jgi:FAD/FMN-containing dehydrogenase